METVNTTARLAALRALMKENGVDIYGMPYVSPSSPVPTADIDFYSRAL